MFNSLPLSVLLPIFVVTATAIWIAGIQLSNTTRRAVIASKQVEAG